MQLSAWETQGKVLEVFEGGGFGWVVGFLFIENNDEHDPTGPKTHLSTSGFLKTARKQRSFKLSYQRGLNK